MKKVLFWTFDHFDPMAVILPKKHLAALSWFTRLLQYIQIWMRQQPRIGHLHLHFPNLSGVKKIKLTVQFCIVCFCPHSPASFHLIPNWWVGLRLSIKEQVVQLLLWRVHTLQRSIAEVQRNSRGGSGNNVKQEEVAYKLILSHFLVSLS